MEDVGFMIGSNGTVGYDIVLGRVTYSYGLTLRSLTTVMVVHIILVILVAYTRVGMARIPAG